MGNINIWEVIAFVIYFVVVLSVGIYFFMKSKKESGEKSYFLGGRNMNGAVAALSAGASDMSAWVLMGLPGAIYASGFGQIWISVGLFIGTALAWIFIAPRLRTFSIAAEDSITIPQYLTKRFKSENKALQVSAAIVFIIVYCIYSASSISACGDLFQSVFGLSDDARTWAMVIAAVIIVVYTFLGGFNAVCWTDFFQGLLMLAALMIVPIVAAVAVKAGKGTEPILSTTYYNLFGTEKFDGNSILTVLSGLGWGLGYFGMPHILIRYMSIKSKKEMNRSRVIGTSWTFLILVMATIVGIVGRKYLGDALLAPGAKDSMVFVNMVKALFPAFLVGILLSAILAASMSTADSQLLASSSAFSSDIYRDVILKKGKTADEKSEDNKVMWAGRFVVLFVCIAALVIALLPNSGSIMDLVSDAWAAFGSAFGPVIILSLYWKRFNYQGAVAGVISGFTVDVVWRYALHTTELAKLYEIIPGFAIGLIVSIIVTLNTAKPSEEVEALFDKGVALLSEEDAE
mgnify:CR=1 FL=1